MSSVTRTCSTRIGVPENVNSRRVLERLGLRYEKNVRHYGFECAYYALSKDEFERSELVR